MRDLGLNPRRKSNLFSELCVRYRPSDYRGLVDEYLEASGRVGEKHANANHQTTTQSPSCPFFLLLSFLGVLGLWIVAYFDGMTDRMETILTTLRMPDGRILRSTYTGIRILDWQLKLLSSFYEVLSNNLTSGPRLLFFDLNFVVACTNLWVLIEGRRRRRGGAKAWYLRWPVWAIVLWNANGAAIVQPIFFWLAHANYQTELLYDSGIPVNEAIALFAVTLPIMTAPLLLFIPAWLGLSTWQHHGYIAMFHSSPLLMAAAFIALSTALRPAITTATTTTTSTSTGSKDPSKKWILASLLSAGTIAAAVHLITISITLLSTDPDASSARLFIPSLARAGVRGFAAVPPAQEYEALIENLHLFSQFDLWVVAASCVLFSHLLLSSAPEGGVSRKDNDKSDRDFIPTTQKRWTGLACLMLGSVVLGPGAAGSFALAVRELRL
jgi:hypothetical protein